MNYVLQIGLCIWQKFSASQVVLILVEYFTRVYSEQFLHDPDEKISQQLSIMTAQLNTIFKHFVQIVADATEYHQEQVILGNIMDSRNVEGLFEGQPQNRLHNPLAFKLLDTNWHSTI